MRGDGAKKQIPRCVPRAPNRGGQEKARNSVRDDTRWLFFTNFTAVYVANPQPQLKSRRDAGSGWRAPGSSCAPITRRGQAVARRVGLVRL